jgi:hypothetical protein
MNHKTLAFFFVFSFNFCVITSAQSFSLKDFREKKVRELPVTGKKATLGITGAKEADKIRIYQSEDSANQITGTATPTGMEYMLDDFLQDLNPGESVSVIIFDGKARKIIDTLLVTLDKLNVGNLNDKELVETNHYEMPIAFYDAMSIYTRITSRTGSQFLFLFRKYNFDFTAATNTADSIAIIRKNKFIDDFFKKFYDIKKDTVSKAKVAAANSALGAMVASLSGIDVTKYVQATADFLRDRIKEELTIAFIERFKSKLDSIPELKALLPRTYNVFNTSDPFKVPSLGQTYKTAFQGDLEYFVQNFELFIDTTSIKRYKDLRTSQVVTAFRVAYHTIDLSAKDVHPVDIFDFIDVRYGYMKESQRVDDINKYVSLLNVLSQNLRKRMDLDSIGWISVEELKTFHPNAIMLFWGLIYQQKKEVFDELKIKDNSLADLIYNGTSTAQIYLKQFVTIAHNIGSRIKEYQRILNNIKLDSEKSKEKAIDGFVANADQLLEINDFVFSFPYFRNPEEFHMSEYYKTWRPIIVDAIETTKGIHAKDYSKIVVNSTSVIYRIARLNDSTKLNEKFIQNLNFYSNFLVDAINADSSKDVKAVLERYAEPVRSYRVKRKAPFSVSVNAYPGLYLGLETFKGENNKNQTARSFGVTAPIGLSFNWGNFPARNWSSSIFVNAVDIAAALSYRWDNDSLDLPEKVTLGQIFAPGIFGVVGFPNLPVSAKLGVQYLPQLRSITKNGNKVDEINAWKIGVSVVVDIPFFNFYNRSE